jgi:putative inorganic carbon (HCO3(-)) transporter
VNTPTNVIAPHKLCWTAAILVAVGAGVLIPMASDLKLQMQVILVLGLAGLAVLPVIPNRRIALVCAWVLALPLSLEKVFQIFPPAYRGFMGSTLVLSGADLVFYVLAIALLLEAVTTRQKVFFWSDPAKTYGLLIVWVCAMFLFMNPTSAGTMQLIHWVKMLAYLVVFSSAIRTREELLTVLVAVAIAVVIQSAVVGTTYVLGHKVGFSSKVSGEAMMSFTGGDDGETITRATGTVGHVNQQAMFHVLFTIPLFGLFMVRNWIWRVFIAVVLAGSFCALILTFSRASWISSSLAAIIIFLLAWRHGRITRQGWMAICLGVLVAATCVGAFSGKIVERITEGDNGASSSRVRMAMLAIDHAINHLVTGVGPGNFINARLAEYPVEWARDVWLPREKDYKPRDLAGLELYEVELQGQWYYMPGVVHNKFLLMAAELGLVGLGLFLWFQWRIFRQALATLRTKDPLLWWIGLALIGAFWANQSEFMFELFYDDKTVLMPLFVDVLIITLARIVAKSEQPEELT